MTVRLDVIRATRLHRIITDRDVCRYIFSNCPLKAKIRLLQMANGDGRQRLLRPMMVDTLIAGAGAEMFKISLEQWHGILVKYVGLEVWV